MKPKIPRSVYVAKTATVSGNVEIGDDSSVWPSASIRAELNKVRIGKRTNIQDNVSIHTDYTHGVEIGDNVTISHNSVVHGCAIKSNVVVGIGVIILDGAVIEENCFIAAGALVGKNKHIPANSMVIGFPGEIARNVSDEEIEFVKKSADFYVDAKNKYKAAKEERPKVKPKKIKRRAKPKKARRKAKPRPKKVRKVKRKARPRPKVKAKPKPKVKAIKAKSKPKPKPAKTKPKPRVKPKAKPKPKRKPGYVKLAEKKLLMSAK